MTTLGRVVRIRKRVGQTLIVRICSRD